MDQFEKRLREYNVVEGTKILVIVKIYGEASVESETYEDDIPDTKELATRFGVKEEDIKMYIDDFNSFDTNKSGKITVTELKRGMAKRGINMTLEQVKKMVQVTDQNHDDSVEMMEFLTVITRVQKANAPNIDQEIKKALESFDQNHDGSISLDELRKAFASLDIPLSEEETAIVFKTIDKNNSGRINQKEFVRSWKEVLGVK